MKNSLSTGQIAEFCGVDYRTVIRWIDAGHLKAFQLPGRGDRRVPIAECVRFLKCNGIPVPKELAGSADCKRILVVEDDLDVAKHISDYLLKHGYEVTTVADGFLAGTALMTFLPALLILDLQIPRLDGFGVLAYVKTSAELKATRILVVSGLGKAKLQAALDAGADAIVEKPFLNAQLLDEVKALIGEA